MFESDQFKIASIDLQSRTCLYQLDIHFAVISAFLQFALKIAAVPI